MRHAIVAIGLICAIAGAAGCGKSDEEKAQEQLEQAAADAAAAIEQAANAAQSEGGEMSAEEMAEGLQAMAKGLEAMSDQQIEPVGFRDLQTFFPDLEGWTKGKPTGEKVSMGLKMSHAGVQYTRGEASIDMEITDSSLNQAMIAPFAMMLATGYEKETADGFERSAKVGGQAGWEQWNAPDRNGELNAVVAKRFIVKIAGSNVDDLATLHDLAGKANLGRLAELK